MRPVARIAAGGAITVTLIATAAACSGTPVLKTGEAVGKPLSSVNRSAPEDTGFLIQDSSPRVGERASFDLSTSNPKDWVVVAICADSTDVNSAGSVEISIIPERAYTASVKSEVKAGEFFDAVTCDDLVYR